MPHAYIVASGPCAAGSSLPPLAVSLTEVSGARPGSLGTRGAGQESMAARLSLGLTGIARAWPAVPARIQPRARSNEYANAISRGSLHAGPISDTPTGSPLTRPAGTVIAGYPETAAGDEVPTV